MKACTLLPKTSLSLPMASSISTLSSLFPHSSSNHCTLPPNSFFGARITLRRATSSSRSLPNTNCRATSATVSFSLPTPKPHSGVATEKTPKWSARAIKSYAMGELEARKLKYPNTGTEALLMGILVEGTSKAAKFLRANGITLFKVREETVELLGKSDMYFFSPEHPPLTEPAQKALDWAIEEKLKSGEGGEINVTHILLGSDKTNRFALLFGTLDGSIGCIAPLDEITFRRLQSLQRKLVDAVSHVAGLNPKAFRQFRSNGKAHRPGPDSIVDCELLCLYEMFPLEEQLEIAHQVGTTRSQILSNLSDLSLGTSFV